jgi:hypothetical protein
MATITSEKIQAPNTVEDIKDEKAKGEVYVSGTLPESLRHKSPEEITALRKRLVRKIDIRLMPMLIILFLLKYVTIHSLESNCSSRYTAFLTETTSQMLGLEAWKTTSDLLIINTTRL